MDGDGLAFALRFNVAVVVAGRVFDAFEEAGDVAGHSRDGAGDIIDEISVRANHFKEKLKNKIFIFLNFFFLFSFSFLFFFLSFLIFIIEIKL